MIWPAVIVGSLGAYLLKLSGVRHPGASAGQPPVAATDGDTADRFAGGAGRCADVLHR